MQYDNNIMYTCVIVCTVDIPTTSRCSKTTMAFVRDRHRRLILICVATLLLVLHLRAPATPSPPAPEPSQSQPYGRILIASNHWNSAKILPVWSAAVLALVEQLGVTNVHVSVYESGSWDDTKAHLRRLDAELERRGVARTMVLDVTTHADELARGRGGDASVGWLRSRATGKWELRRIPYLARLRNEVLRPLATANATHGFDRILFVNDVVFSARDALALLATRAGAYAAACALDFRFAGEFYDTFALRDADGRPAASQRWPFFGAGRSRRALGVGDSVVPVRACWNGMVAFDAAPFVRASLPLRFRAIDDALADAHVEASECCLVHYDNPLSREPGKGVWVNTDVRVAYSVQAYEASRVWPTVRERAYGWAASLVAGLLGLPWRNAKVARRLRSWGGVEAGADCLIDEMQVLRGNGWKHL